MMQWFFDDEGCLVIRARLAPEDGAIVVRAIEAAEEQLADVSAETRGADVSAETFTADPNSSNPWEQRRADAFLSIAESFLASGPRSLEGAERTLVVLHTEQEALSGVSECGI